MISTKQKITTALGNETIAAMIILFAVAPLSSTKHK
jgi:hypothetical protein